MSEIGKVYFDISQRVQKIFGVNLKYSNKRARNIKLAWMFLQ